MQNMHIFCGFTNLMEFPAKKLQSGYGLRLSGKFRPFDETRVTFLEYLASKNVTELTKDSEITP